MENKNVEMSSIPTQLLKEIQVFLETQPFRQVAGLILAISQTAKPIKMEEANDPLPTGTEDS